MSFARAHLAVVVGVAMGLPQLAGGSENFRSVWQCVEECDIIWVATVESIDGVEVVLDVHRVLRGQRQKGTTRLTLPRRSWGRPPPREPPPLGDESTEPAPRLPYRPDPCGLVPGREYIVFGRRQNDGKLYAQADAPHKYLQLTDENRAEKIEAIEKLQQLTAIDDPHERALAIIDTIKKEDGFLRKNLVGPLAGCFHAIEDKSPYVEHLLAMLDADDPALQIIAMQVSGARFGPELLPRLIELSQGDDDDVAIQAIGYVAAYDTPEALDAVLAAAQHASANRRVAACGRLSTVQDERAYQARIRLLDDSDANVRTAAVWLIRFQFERFDLDSLIPKLISLLDDPEPTVCRAAATILANRPDERAVGPLLAKLTDGNTEVVLRGNISSTLVGFCVNGVGREQIVASRAEIITAMYGAGGGQTAVNFARLLKEIGVDESLDIIIADTQSDDPQRRKQACMTLGEFPAPRAYAAMVAMLDDNDDDVRWLVVEMVKSAFWGKELEAAVPRLVGLLADPSEKVRHSAARTLPAKSSWQAIRALLAELASQRNHPLEVRQEIIEVLLKHYPHVSDPLAASIAADVSPYVAVLAKSTDTEGASAAIGLLRYIGTPKAIDALERAARAHPVEEIRQQAKESITPSDR